MLRLDTLIIVTITTRNLQITFKNPKHRSARKQAGKHARTHANISSNP